MTQRCKKRLVEKYNKRSLHILRNHVRCAPAPCYNCPHLHFSSCYFAHLQVILRTRTYFTQAFHTRDLGEKCPTLQSAILSRRAAMSSVGLAVDRARSMLNRSQLRGACSRLNSRERLRAASTSVPSAPKRVKREFEKPFEFVLVKFHEEDADAWSTHRY